MICKCKTGNGFLIHKQFSFQFGDFEENMFKIGLRLDDYESISFKLGMMRVCLFVGWLVA